MKNALLDLFGLNECSVGTLNESFRVKWIEKSIRNISQGLRILDAGAGEQQFKKFCTHLEYVSQDFAQYTPETTESGLQKTKWDYGKLDIISDIASIPEPDNSFDAILCTEVLEHIVNPTEAIEEFSRLLKAGGSLILTAPFCSLTHFAPFHFHSGFNRYFYEKVLSEHGFEIKELVANGNYFEYIGQEIKRLPIIAKRYAAHKLTISEKIALRIVQKLLHRASFKDSRSNELLNFGYQVIAIKK